MKRNRMIGLLLSGTLLLHLAACGSSRDASLGSQETAATNSDGRTVVTMSTYAEVPGFEQAFREIASMVLEMSDFEVEQACDGTEAVEKVLNTEPGYYDAVLMDIQMPKMTGYEATRAIRAADSPNAGIPIIAMTANAFEEDKKAALDAGMNGHVAKPIDVAALLRVLSDVLKNGG